MNSINSRMQLLAAQLNGYLRKTIYLLMFAAGSVMASEINITARFLPNANNPDVNKFENTTANSGYCAIYPARCTGGIFSISIPNVTWHHTMKKGQNVGIRVPYAWRELQVTHSDGSTQTVKVRIVGLGANYRIEPNVLNITGFSSSEAGRAHDALWGGLGWIVSPAGCTSTYFGAFTPTYFTFFWLFNSANTCAKTSSYDVYPGVYFSNINIMYEMQTPNPLAMSMGTYRGKLNYTFGANGDFAFSTSGTADPNVTLNFTLSVQHQLRVQFPPATNHLALAPEGGWQQWIYNGASQLPKKLLANQPYQLWSSTRFKMQLRCQYSVGNDCALQNDYGDTQVPVKTAVTLPYGMQDSSNKTVNRYPLSNSTASIFKPTRYVSDERAVLHFEVEKSGVEQMVNSGGGRFRGNVTVIWDSEI